METIKPQKTKRKNGFAIVGFSLGIASIFFASIGIVPVLAIIFSAIGLSKNNLKNGGKGLAIAGLILGILYLIVSIYMNGNIF